MLVSIIIPVYKKEETVVKDILNIWKTVKQTRWDCELIVVIDGFVDKSFERAKTIKKKNIKVFGYPTNKGKGYAVKYGMARARGDLVAFIDSGMEINPNSISMVLEHMEWYDADVIVGSKRHPASKTNLTALRKLYSWGYYQLVKYLFGLRVKDTQAGLKVFRRKVLEKVLPRLLVKEYAFDVELLAVTNHLGFTRIYEAPIEITLDFDNSRFSKNWFPFMDKHIRKMMVDTLAVFYRLYLLRYYDDTSKRKWTYDNELKMRINTGEVTYD
ncbi:glycosyltransferase family 2 protein [Patescibacteria group bacterium]|nr:glycosyltransferase family 2 protein [Patescibacteria group bacterium]